MSVPKHNPDIHWRDLSDDDDIELVETDLEGDFEVKEIVAEREFDGGTSQAVTKYLTRWSCYDDEDCTWEPEDSFADSTLRVWRRKKRDIQQGRCEPFDVAEIERLMDGQRKRRAERHERRQAKVKRLKLKKKKLMAQRSTVQSERPCNAMTPKRKRAMPLGTDIADVPSETVPDAKRRRRLQNRKNRKHLFEQDSETDADAVALSDDDAIKAPCGTIRLEATSHTSDDGGKDKPGDGGDGSEDRRQDGSQDGSEGQKTLNNVEDSQESLFGPENHSDEHDISDADIEIAGPIVQPTQPIDAITYAASPKITKVVRKTNNRPLLTARRPGKPGISMSSAPVAPRRQSGLDNDAAANSQGGNFKRLSIQNRVQKWSRNEPSPDISKLIFKQPETATQTTSPILSIPVTQSVRFAADVAAPSSDAEITPDNSGTSERLAANRRNSTDPAWIKSNVTCRAWLKNGRPCDQGEACRFDHRNHPKVEPKKNDVCAHWDRDGRCKFADNVCDFWHAYKDPVTAKFTVGRPESRDSTHQPAHNVTCRFWLRLNDCRKPDCKNAHHSTDYVTPKFNKECKHWRAQDSCKFSSAICHYYHCCVSENGTPSHVKAFQTCQKWKEGSCPYSDESCSHYHAIWEQGWRRTHDLQSNDVDDLPDTPASTMSEPLFEPHYFNLNIHHGSETSYIKVTLTWDIGDGQILGEDAHVRAFCAAADFKAYLLPELNLQIGSIAAKDNSDELSGSQQLKSFATYLSNTGFCAIGSIDHETAMAIYPANDAAWDFIPTQKADDSIALRFCAWPMPEADKQRASSGAQSSEQLHHQMAAKLGIDVEHLFFRDGKLMPEKHVFIMFPEHLIAESHLIAHFLLSHQVTVYLPNAAGSWRLFWQAATRSLKESSAGGTVLWHSSVTNFAQIPDLWRYLSRTSLSHFRVVPNSDGFSPLFSLTKVFEAGRMALMTDTMLEEQPLQALQVVKDFCHDAFKATNPDYRDRLFVRPDIIPFVQELRVSAEKRQDAEKAEALKKIGQYMLDLLYPWARPNPKFNENADPVAVAVPDNELPGYKVAWQSNKRKATEMLVQYFAATTLIKCGEYRGFQIVYASKSESDNERGSSGEEENMLTPRSPFTPRTPGPDGQQAVQSAQEPHWVSKWKYRFNHIWFLSGEDYISKVAKKK